MYTSVVSLVSFRTASLFKIRIQMAVTTSLHREVYVPYPGALNFLATGNSSQRRIHMTSTSRLFAEEDAGTPAERKDLKN